jgi:hypothetical protein
MKWAKNCHALSNAVVEKRRETNKGERRKKIDPM